MKKNLVCLLVLFCSTICTLSSQTINGKGFQQFRVGDIEAVVLTDGHLLFPSAQPVMAPGVSPELVSAQLENYFVFDNSVDLSINVLLLKKDNRLILIDAGQGSGSDKNGSLLVNNLKEIGISPEQITDILITHAHGDHIGGLIDAEGKSVFPNASIYISRVEYEFWTEGQPDFSKSKPKQDAVRVAGMVESIRNTLSLVKPQLKFVESGASILDCIQVEIVPGHTKGHLVSTVSSNGEELILIADVVHAYALLFAHPEWGTAFDYDFDQGVDSRLKTFKKLTHSKSLVFGYHLPYPGVGHIREIAADSYEWVPFGFGSPQMNK